MTSTDSFSQTPTSSAEPHWGPRVLVTGVTSIHGWPIFRRLSTELGPKNLVAIRPPKSRQPEAPNVRSACITNCEILAKLRDEFRPDFVVHAAGVCDLDVCQERPRWARAMNRDGTRNIVRIFGDESSIIYLSTDLVFDGEDTPRRGYREIDAPRPISVVGETYAEAERELSETSHLTLRLGLPMGESLLGSKGAVDWIEGRFRRGRPATLFVDEWRSCIDCEEVADVVLACMRERLKGLFHLGGPRRYSLYEIGQLVVEYGGYHPSLLKRLRRVEEVNGPPRIGDVSLDSRRLESRLGRPIRACRWFEVLARSQSTPGEHLSRRSTRRSGANIAATTKRSDGNKANEDRRHSQHQ